MRANTSPCIAGATFEPAESHKDCGLFESGSTTLRNIAGVSRSPPPKTRPTRLNKAIDRFQIIEISPNSAMFLTPRSAPFQSSVGDLRQSRHEEAVDGHARRDIAKLLQRFQHLTKPRARDRAGRLEKVPAEKKIVAL